MLLLFFMDGIKYNSYSKHMPFLRSLNSAPLISDFGYSCCCHATMYSGVYPKEHGTWFIWKKGDNSPYRWIKWIPFLKYMNFIPVKYVISRFTRKFIVKSNTSYSGIPMLVNLPLKYWPYFETSETLFWTDDQYLGNKDTLFKILKKEHKNYDIVGLNKKASIFEDLKDFRLDNKDFYYFFIGETDNLSHQYGSESKELTDYLMVLDKKIEELYKEAIKLDGDSEIIVFSDHGHIGVEEYVNLHNIFKENGLKLNKYLNLIEATFARFWCKNKKEYDEIFLILKKLEEDNLGFIVTDDILKKWNLPSNREEQGHIIFHLNAPRMFTNTIWGYGKKTVSAHGYYPELPNHKGIFVSNKELDKKEYKLIDILPMVLKAIDKHKAG